MKINITKEEQSNPFFDPAKANNGGGYDQPHIEAVATFPEFTGEDEGYTLNLAYSDTSCGDYGDRWALKVASSEDESFEMWCDQMAYSESKDDNDLWGEMHSRTPIPIGTLYPVLDEFGKLVGRRFV